MNEYEDHIREIARRFYYPSTPALRRQWGRSTRPASRVIRPALATIVLLVVVVMVTPLRAAVLEFLRIGAVTIIYGEPPATMTPLPSLLDLFGETKLDKARQEVDFALLRPAGFGPPDYVYYQSDTVIMVWQAEDNQPALALYQIGRDDYMKILSIGQNTLVDGQPALWTDVPHTLEYQQDGDPLATRQVVLVEGHVLIWQAEGVTYRLETALSMDEAVAIAESLR